MITEKPSSDGAATREVMPGPGRRRHKGLDNQAKSSHQPIRRRGWRVTRFTSPRQAQCFLPTRDRSDNLFHLRSSNVTAIQHHATRKRAFML
jgi:putative transposase